MSEAGRMGAADLAEVLGASSIAAVYSSPARRARETIQPLAESLGVEPQIVADLRERELSVPPGASFESVVEAAWRQPDDAQGGSESNRVAAARGIQVLRQALAAHQGRPFVLSTHGNLLMLVLNALDPSYGYEALT